MNTLLLNTKRKLCEVIRVDIVACEFFHESMQYNCSHFHNSKDDPWAIHPEMGYDNRNSLLLLRH